LATRQLIMPVLGLFVAAVGCPLVLARTVAGILGLEGAARTNLFRTSYPLMMAIYLIVFGVKEGYVVLTGWSQSQYIRDQEYLVGRRLHNLTEEEEIAAAAEEAQEQGQQQQQHPELGAPAGTANGIQAEAPARPLARSARRIYGRDDRNVGIDGEDDDTPPLEPVPSDGEEDDTAFRTEGRRLGKEPVYSSWFERGGATETGGGQGSSSSMIEDGDMYTNGDREGFELDDDLTLLSEYVSSSSSSSRSQIRRSQRLQAIRDNQEDR